MDAGKIVVSGIQGLRFWLEIATRHFAGDALVQYLHGEGFVWRQPVQRPLVRRSTLVGALVTVLSFVAYSQYLCRATSRDSPDIMSGSDDGAGSQLGSVCI